MPVEHSGFFIGEKGCFEESRSQLFIKNTGKNNFQLRMIRAKKASIISGMDFRLIKQIMAWTKSTL